MDGAGCDVTDNREFILVKGARLQYMSTSLEWSSMTCVDVELPVVVWLLARQEARLGRCVSDEVSQQGGK